MSAGHFFFLFRSWYVLWLMSRSPVHEHDALGTLGRMILIFIGTASAAHDLDLYRHSVCKTWADMVMWPRRSIVGVSSVSWAPQRSHWLSHWKSAVPIRATAPLVTQSEHAIVGGSQFIMGGRIRYVFRTPRVPRIFPDTNTHAARTGTGTHEAIRQSVGAASSQAAKGKSLGRNTGART